MAQTVHISAGYSDKTSESYNYQQFCINPEMDAQINGTTEIEQESPAPICYDEVEGKIEEII